MSSQVLGSTESLPTEQLTTYHKNPRQGDTETIAQSLRANGQFRPLVVNRGTHTGRPYEVLAGNHTLLAARELSGTEDAFPRLDCYVIDVEEDHARRIVLADNRTGDLATYDDKLLLELLETADTVAGTGYKQEDLDALIAANNKALDSIAGLGTDLDDDDDYAAEDSTPPWINDEAQDTDDDTEEDDDEEPGDSYHYSTLEEEGIDFHIKKNDSLIAISFSVTPDQRTTIRAVLSDVKQKHGLEDQVEALIHLFYTHPDIDTDKVTAEYEKAITAPVDGDNSAGKEN